MGDAPECLDERLPEVFIHEHLPQPRWSPSGRYSLKVCTSEHTHLLQVRRSVDGHVIVIDPNPGGDTRPSFEAAFTAADNILTGWGCGTYCGVNLLLSPEGQELHSWDGDFRSPGGRYIVTFPVFPYPHEAELEVVDLRTGRVVHAETIADFDPPCSIAWDAGSATIKPCDESRPSATLPVEEP